MDTMTDLTPDPIDVIAEALSRRTPAEVGGEPITDAYLPRGVAVVVANALTEAGLQVIPISAGLKPEWLTRMANACRNMQDRMRLCIDGITECHRVLKPGGHLLVKCQDQVCSGHVRWQTIEFAGHAVELGSRLVDQLHLPSYRPQPAGRRQIHARRNYSTLLVLRKDVS